MSFFYSIPTYAYWSRRRRCNMPPRYVDLDGPKQSRLFSYGQNGGKGDAPRKGMNRDLFRENFDKINWNDEPSTTKQEQ